MSRVVDVRPCRSLVKICTFLVHGNHFFQAFLLRLVLAYFLGYDLHIYHISAILRTRFNSCSCSLIFMCISPFSCLPVTQPTHTTFNVGIGVRALCVNTLCLPSICLHYQVLIAYRSRVHVHVKSEYMPTVGTRDTSAPRSAPRTS